MENATKALMIAGAVLLAIMIIGIGMLIYNNSVGSVTAAISKMSQQEKDIFNNKFVQYEGMQSGSNVKTLITTVITNNNQMKEEGTEEKQVSFDGKTESSDLETLRKSIVSGKKYDITVNIDNTTGLVKTITSEDKSTVKQ